MKKKKNYGVSLKGYVASKLIFRKKILWEYPVTNDAYIPLHDKRNYFP